MKRRKILLGVWLFSVMLVAVSFYKLWGFSDYNNYYFMFQYLPDNIIFIRYICSILLRIFAIFIALGLLWKSEKVRKLFVVFCIFSIVIAPFKHPYKVFENIAILTEHTMEFKEYPKGTTILESGYPRFPSKIQDYSLTTPTLPIISMGFYMVIDLLFFAGALIYFTRPHVKKYFDPDKDDEDHPNA